MTAKAAGALVGGVQHGADEAGLCSRSISAKSGAWSAKRTATMRVPLAACFARAAMQARDRRPRQTDLDDIDSEAAIRSTASAMTCGCMGRSPAVALSVRRPATARTASRMTGAGRAPRAPLCGSFRSMMSAPAARTISASAADVTLARKPVMPAAPLLPLPCVRQSVPSANPRPGARAARRSCRWRSGDSRSRARSCRAAACAAG